MKVTKCLSLLTAFCAVITLTAGCGGTVPTGTSSRQTGSSSTPTTTTASTTVPTTAAPTRAPGERNPLTGLPELESGAATRPVAVMIGNDSRSRPQYGLDKADILVEAETEGGITRLMAVFANASRVPAKLGPVRSARSPFALLAQSLDAVYVHAGGSTGGLTTIQSTGIAHIDGLVYDGSTFWRDAQLRQTKGLEYSMLTSGDKLAARIKAAGIRTSSDRGAPFSFGDKTGSGKGQAVQVVYSGAQSVSFVYDAATGLYTKSNGKLGSATLHKTADGALLTFANVLVMADQKYAENEATISFRLSRGEGLLVSGGTSREIRWTRTGSRLSFLEADGSPLQAAPGKTYICLVAQGNAGATVLQ